MLDPAYRTFCGRSLPIFGLADRCNSRLARRMLAYSTLAVGTWLAFAIRARRAVLPAEVASRANVLAAVVWGQAALGVTTILMEVPVYMGVMHQAGALTAWTVALWLCHSFRFVPVGARLAAQASKASSAAVAAERTKLAQSLRST